MNSKTFETFTKSLRKSGHVNRILIAGASGRLGKSLYPYLKQFYGAENILLADITHFPGASDKHFRKVDVRDKDNYLKSIKEFKADTLLHIATIKSAKGEHDPQHCLEVNTSGTLNAIELAKENNLRLFYASSIDTFGPDTPRRNAPSLTLQRPQTMSGVSGTYMELFGSYYHYKFKTDFRCLRIPNLIAPNPSLHGVFKDATQIYYDAVSKGKFVSHLKPHQHIPSVYIEDLATGAIRLLEADSADLKMRIYNIGSCTFTAAQQAEELKKHLPNFGVEYKSEHNKTICSEQYPQSIDDFDARNDFGHEPHYDLAHITTSMVQSLKKH